MAWIKPSIIYVISIWGFSIPVMAQKETVSSYLNRYSEDAGIKAYDDYISGLTKLAYSIPLVEEVNLRTETDQFNFGRQEYAIRTMFNGFGEAGAYSNEGRYLREIKEAEKEIYVSGRLYERYKELIDLHYTLKQIPLLDKLYAFKDSLLGCKIALLQKGNYIAPKDILRLEEDLFKLREKQAEILSIATSLRRGLGVPDTEFDWGLWPETETMRLVIDTLSFDRLPAAVQQKYAADLNLEEARLQLDKKKDHRILDYAQLRYSKRDNLLFQDEFSIGLGLRLPYRGSHRRAENEYLEERFGLQLEMQVKEAVGAENFKQEKISFTGYINELKFFQERNPVYGTLNANHPENQLAVNEARRELMLIRQRRQVELEAKIAGAYIDLLYLSGRLQAQPRINYLDGVFSRL
ncbi:MAG: hypothetical protein IPN29_20025 [Saprospiraceae bacterium]|nr:hypothetical protein [Saprospiraceae bacterium]